MLTKCCWDNQIAERVMGRACGIHGPKCVLGFGWENVEEQDFWETKTYMRIILKWTLENRDGCELD